ncbi:MAG: peptide chain release factor 2 [Gemmatimonadota bacterium]|nr:peptide chain release factor 2 [Gemmatimonadota bacterium]MDQ8152240.1 peptide chain release factor 2 [Gemmatimonadota bacterium]MDQ8177888.1 peptide chain release factor 2 [Gemmatimonadota bacterium]
MADSEHLVSLRHDQTRLDELRRYLDLDRKRERLTALEGDMSDPGFWNAQERAREVVQEVKTLKGWIDPYERLVGRTTSAIELAELLSLEPDAEMEADVAREAKAIGEETDAYRLRSLLQGRDDFRDAQVEISAGAGGTEAQDWAQMLMRMYTRWAERKGYTVDLLDLSEGEEAGIKGAVLEVKGEYAFGFLRPETGVHRLVRISPFDSQARRHTSFASVFVYPVVNEEINIEVREEDLRIDVYRASGAGGQHVNKTSSAVRITHLPTGIVCASQQERSQFKNKATAMKMLKNRLYNLEAEKQAAAKAALDATKQDVSFGSQIRSYVFQPYTMVNDHRTELKITDVQKVMDGAIDPFIEAYLKQSGAPAAAGETI